MPLVVGNDGNMGGVAEAQRVRGDGHGSVLMLAPGSGLGCAYIDPNGLPLDGDTLAGMEASHMPAPLHLLGAKAYPCGCGRDVGLRRGLHQPVRAAVPAGRPAAGATPSTRWRVRPEPDKKKAFALRGLAQQGDPLARRAVRLPGPAMGLHVANLAMALDPTFVVIGGGLMDPGRDLGRVPRALPADPAGER